MAGWRRWQTAYPAPSDQPNLNRRGAQYVGRRFDLVEPIARGRGRIKLGDSSWTVTGPDLPAGQTVEVIGADGAVLQVRALPGDRSPLRGKAPLARTGRRRGARGRRSLRPSLTPSRRRLRSGSAPPWRNW